MNEAKEKLIKLMYHMNWFGTVCYITSPIFITIGLLFYYNNEVGGYGFMLIICSSLIILLLGRVYTLLMKATHLIIKEHL